MHGNVAWAAAAYKQVEVNSRSPLELVVMLYDGALSSLDQARLALARHDLVTKAAAISRALSIVGQLQSSLNMEDGRDIADHLDRLYVYITERIVQANLEGRGEPIDEAVRLLTTLRGAWAQIAEREAGVAS